MTLTATRPTIYAGLVRLLERDHELGVIRSALAAASRGEGGGVAVSGEPGAGKSTLIGAAATDPVGLRVVRGGCDPLRTPRPLGPFLDTASELDIELLAGDEALTTVCEKVYDALRATPTLLVVEDLHWVDAASVEVLRFLTHRSGSLPLAMVVSYRDHEIGPRHPARALLGDLARDDGFTTLALDPLSIGAVEQLVAGTALAADQVHQVTGGNPFFVAEVVKDPDRPLPASVRDAVLARAADLDDADLDVLQLVAAAPDRLVDRVLPALGVDLPTLRRLQETGLLDRARGGLVFRHELARQAVETTVPAGGSADLHARLLAAMERVGMDEPAVLTHHAVAAHDRERAFRYARAAADDAVRAAAHTEAAAFLETALDHLVTDDPRERAELTLELAFQLYMTSRLREAIDHVESPMPLWESADDAAGLAAAHEMVAVFEYYNARAEQARSHADHASDLARSAAPEDLVFGSAQATRGYLAYRRGESDRALQWNDDASRVAVRMGDDQLTLRSRFLHAASDLAKGSGDARAQLADWIEAARSLDLDELASTGYSNLVSLDVEQRRFRAAENVLGESLPFTVEKDIPICRHWQTGVRSRLHFSQGHWSAALEDAGAVLIDDGMPLAMVWPLLVSALVPLRRGEAGPELALDHAADLAARIGEPMMRIPVHTARVERAWTTGDPDPHVGEGTPDVLASYDGDPALSWAVGDLVVWLRRLGLPTPVPDPERLPEPYRLSLSGRHDEAAAWWHRTGDPFAEAMAWGDSEDPAHRSRGVELLDRLGAVGTADRRRAELRRDGIATAPAKPRASTRANPGGLTNRQLDVARLVARGFTNAEIAERLYISPKTTDHHVSAVLMKLGLGNRRQVVVRADELGLA